MQVKIIESLPAAKMLDWTVQPYVSIEVVEHDQACPDGTYDVFNRTWHGTVLGCISATEGVVAGGECNAASNRLQEIAPKVQSNGLGTRICGRPGGQPFLHAVRPDLETTECPEGTAPCSRYTSPENTLCYPESELEGSCPITYVSFFEGTPDDQPAEYTTFALGKRGKTPSLSLAYTRTLANNLPLTSFLIESTPCLLPYQNYTQQAEKHYPLDRDQDYPSECSETLVDDF